MPFDPPAGPLPATDAQVKALYAIIHEALFPDDMDECDAELEAWCQDKYGLLPDELDRMQASEAIDALKEEYGL